MTGAARDLAAEEVTREFTGWAEAQGYGDDELYSFAEMDETFAAGMQAARDLDAAQEPKPAPELAALRELVADVLRTFRGAHHGDTQRSDIGRRTFEKWNERAAEAGVKHW